jgi:glutamate-ammonia-ligase adenylyltransferase
VYDSARGDATSDGARPLDGARWYARLAQRVVHLLGVLTRAGRLYEVDVRLRPDGSKGMLVQGLDAYATYQRERAWTWERQALVRARAIAGDATLSRRFEQLRLSILARAHDNAAVRAEIAAMRARWRAGRDRSDARCFDLKQGSGGLVDIEFLLQSLVLQHAHDHPALLASGNSADLIAALATAGVLPADDAAALATAHAALLDCALRCTLDARPRLVERTPAIEHEAALVTGLASRHGLT